MGLTMPICEMCGVDSPKAKRVFLEGTLLLLCPKCSLFGKETVKEKEERIPSPPVRTPAPYTGVGKRGSVHGRGLDSGEMVLRGDFNKVISKARNINGLTQDELARKINEKKSVIAKLESKQLHPNDALRKKLEKTLHIVLTEKVESSGSQMKKEGRSVTIGDMIKMKKE